MGTSVQVRPGKSPTVLQDDMPSGTLIYNSDLINSVWLDDTSSVSPGQGTVLGPQGSLTWTTDGARVYACVDTGVITPITVQLSPDVNNVQNPVAIGVAVALQLEQQGIPNVLVEDTLFNGILSHPGGTITLDVSKYASLLVTNGLAVVNYQFLDDNGDIVDEDLLISSAAGGINRSSRLAVIAKRIKFTNNNTFDTSIVVTASNRTVPYRLDTRFNNALPDVWSINQIMTAGGQYILNETLESQLQGLVYMVMTIGANTGGGRILLVTPDTGQQFIIGDTAVDCAVGSFTSLFGSKLVALPPQRYNIQWLNKTATGTAAGVSITFIPANIS